MAALDAELAENLREQRRDLEDRLAAASSSVDAATLEARRRELQQVGGLGGRAGQAGRSTRCLCMCIVSCWQLLSCRVVDQPLVPCRRAPACLHPCRPRRQWPR